MATSDECPEIAIDSEHVSINVVNARTARLAQQFIDDATQQYLDEDDGADEPTRFASPASLSVEYVSEPNTGPVPDTDHKPVADDVAVPEETVDKPEPEPDTEANPEPDPEPDTEAEPEPDAEEISLTATAGAPWDDYDDRDARVEAYIDARYDYEGGPFETVAGVIGDVVGESGVGVSYALKNLQAYDAETTGETSESGSNIWRITEATDEDDAEEADTAGDDADGEVTAEDMPDLHDEQIEIDSRSGGTVTVAAVDVIDAVADAPTIYYLHGNLGTDKDAAEGLLHKLDLYEHFQDEAPLERSLVRETVAGYLEVDG